jgi:hypothetical protein
MTIRNIAISILGAALGVLGAFIINGLLVYYFDGVTFKGHALFWLEITIFSCWYGLISFLVAKGLNNQKMKILLIIGVVITTVLLATSQAGYELGLSKIEHALVWLEVYAHYLIAIPVFYVVGLFHVREHGT